MNNEIIIRNLILSACFIFIFLIAGSGYVSASTISGKAGNESIADQAERLKDVTSEIRGLPFIDDLPVELITADELADIINEILDEELDEEMDYKFSELYIILGLMSRGTSIREGYQEMIEEQAAGLYDPHEKCFYVVDIDMSEVLSEMLGDLGPAASFLEGFMQGMGYDFGAIMTETIIVHEMTHALDDQHFDIEGTMEELMELHSDDAQFAYQSLLEGNATRSMNIFQYEQLGFDESMADMISGMNMSMAEKMLDYDPLLERTMLVPYLQGEVFIRHIIEQGGMDAVNDAFEDPPRSMEQVLHPERYMPYRDEPSYVEAPDLSSALPGWELETTNTIGELLIGLMFELQGNTRSNGERIADGWDYDVETTWRSPGGDLALAMVTIWDDVDEAVEFFEAYQNLLETKHPNGTWATRSGNYCRYTGAGLAAVIELDGRTVVIVEGVPENLADSCLDAAQSSRVHFR